MKAKVRATRAVLAQLCAAYPACFKMLERARRPIMIGIHEQLEGKFPQPWLSRALGLYSGNVGYLLAMKEGTPRIGLDGQPTQQLVTAEEAQHAQVCIEGCRAKQQRRKQAAKQQPPPVSISSTPISSTPKRGDGLASLKAAALKRKDAERPHAS